MDEFSPDEIESIVKAINVEPQKLEEVPLKPQGQYVSKVAFSPLDGEKPRPLKELTEREHSRFGHLKASVEVIFGRTKMTLNELAAIKEGSLIPLDDLSDDLVEIFVNGEQVGRGEVVAVDGHFGVRIVTLS
ncbi:MAG: FliM/FliN family flagellar motor switch protein [Chlamydiae bacterium]|nr:hypothetical protein [Chlamydiales bacterium]MCH9703981.1 FliM/FliN family flagellar motor switch protein [Chlamydiota bacterium]